MVFVVNAKNAGLRIKTAFFAALQFFSSNKLFASSLIIGAPSHKLNLVNTCAGAILSFFRRAGLKRFLAMLAVNCNATFQMHCFVITRARAIFCFVCSRRNVLKLRITNSTIGGNLNFCSMRQARTRTIFGGFFSVFWDFKNNRAVFANNVDQGKLQCL